MRTLKIALLASIVCLVAQEGKSVSVFCPSRTGLKISEDGHLSGTGSVTGKNAPTDSIAYKSAGSVDMATLGVVANLTFRADMDPKDDPDAKFKCTYTNPTTGHSVSVFANKPAGFGRCMAIGGDYFKCESHVK